ncbi:MAG: AmmeMemoRadiSam system radical SAM enzyme [Candidatus Bathyarchaeia archaeon]
MSLGVGSISGDAEIKAFSIYPTVKEALFYEVLGNKKVKCSLCERRCEITEGNVGFCRTRKNFGGKLYTLVYGDISAIESRPIEIKPFFHYWPGSTALTFSTWSCNLDCIWCQNYRLSKTAPNPAKAVYYPPEKIVGLALAYGDAGLCASFQEPTLLTEWAIQTFSLGKSKGIQYCCYVSNGYMTLEALTALRDAGMDGLKIDVKGDHETYMRYCGGADVEKVWRNAAEAKRLGLHVEIVNLVISGVNDSENTLRWVIENHLKHVGPETPLHFTRYFPAYKFHNPPTRVETLKRAYEMARKAGVLYPYIGNVTGHKYENTYCPNCGGTLIKRYGYYVLKYAITENKKCQRCGTSIPITGHYLGR